MTPGARPIRAQVVGAKREKTSYAIFLTDEDTGQVILDAHGIPEHVVQQVALLVGKLLPLSAAVRAGVEAVRSLQSLGDQLAGLVPQRPRRVVRGRR